MNDIIAHNSTIIRDNLIVDSSSSSASSSLSMDKLAHEDIIDGFSFLTFEFESELRKEYEKRRLEFSKASADNCSSSSSSAKSRKKLKTPSSGVKVKSVAKTISVAAASSTASNSSFNDDQASVTAESTSAPAEEPRPAKSPSPPPPSADEQPSKKPKLDEPGVKSSYDMNTLLAAAASAAATAAVVAATGSSNTASPSTAAAAPNHLPPPSFDPTLNPFLAGSGSHPSDPASSLINKIMEMCKQQIPNLNIPGILSKAEPVEPTSVKQNPTTSKHLTTPVTFNHHQQQQQQNHQQQHSNIQKQVTNSNNNQQQSVNTNPYSYMPYPKSAPIESAKYATMPMMSASSSKDAFMYSHVSKPAPIQIAKPVKKAAGLTQYYPRTNGKWCAAHAKIANMIQEQKSKNSLASKQQQQQQQQHQQQQQQHQQQQIHQHNHQQPMFSHQQMFDAYHTKKLHTPTFFPPVQHNLKQQPLPPPPPPAPQQQHQQQQQQQQQQTAKSSKSVPGARGHNLLATEAAITAAANHQMMMDKYRQDMMRMNGPGMMPGPPGMPFMPPPPGMHVPMPPFMTKSKKPVHPGMPLPLPPPTASHLAPFSPNPLVQHSFLQQFFMDKNFDPSRFALPGMPPPPPPPPGCLMPNMLKPDDKPIT